MRLFLLASTAAAIVLSASNLAQAQVRSNPSVAAGMTETGEKFAFSDEDRVILRRYVKPTVQLGMTTGSTALDEGVTPGETIPDSVPLRTFPAGVYHESPRLSAYRYIQIGPRAYVVDPRDRMVVEAID
jgi:hypothetical protein